MQINSLETTLRRINQIQIQFEKLSGEDQTQQATEFQNVLNNASQKTEGGLTNLLPSISLTSFGDTAAQTQALPDVYKEMISKNAKEKGIAPSFLKAVIQTESNFNPNAKSPVGALGLMQLMPSTAKEMGIENPLDPAQNVNGGAKYLKSLLEKYNGNKELALAAYNAGSGAVEKYGGVPPYRETQSYIQKVLQSEKNFSDDEE